MIFENEVTVEVEIDILNLHKLLIDKRFSIKRKYTIKDIYYSNIEVNNNYLDILKDCILIRNIIEKDKDTKMITYKHKEFDDKGNIIKQGKVKCNIESIESGCLLFESLKYNKIIEINDNLTVYENDEDEMFVQEVNNKHIYIEIEDKKYNSIDEMINVFNKYNIPIKSNNYLL